MEIRVSKCVSVCRALGVGSPRRWPILSTSADQLAHSQYGGKNRRRVTFVGNILTFCGRPAHEKHDSLGHPKIIFSVNLSSPQFARERVATFTAIQQSGGSLGKESRG